MAIKRTKEPGNQIPKWFSAYMNAFKAELNVKFNQISDKLANLEQNQVKDHALLLKVIKLNNLKTE